MLTCPISSFLIWQSLKHNPNGRFVVVCGDGEYIIYTALAWRNRSFGSALEFVWSTEGEYAVRESTTKIKIFSKTFQVAFLVSCIPFVLSFLLNPFTFEAVYILRMLFFFPPSVVPLHSLSSVLHLVLFQF